jgi:hypothetical protein
VVVHRKNQWLPRNEKKWCQCGPIIHYIPEMLWCDSFRIAGQLKIYTMKKAFIITAFLTLSTWVYAQDTTRTPSKKVVDKTKSAAKSVGREVNKDAKAVGKGVEKGAKKVGETAKKGYDATKKGVKKAGKGIEKGYDATKKGVKETSEKVRDGVH